MEKDNDLLPEEQLVEDIKKLLQSSNDRYRILARKAAKKPTFIIHNKVGWIAWLLGIVLSIILGAGGMLFSLRPNQAKELFQTAPAMADSIITIEKEDALTALKRKYGK